MSNPNQSEVCIASVTHASEIKYKLTSLTLPFLLTLLFIAVYLENSIAILGIVVLSAVIILADPIIGLCLYIATATSGNFFAFVIQGVSLSRLYGILYVFASLLTGLRNSKHLRFRISVVSVSILLILLNLSSQIYALSLSGWWDGFITMTLNIALFLVTIAYKWDDERTLYKLYECMGITLVFFIVYLLGTHGIEMLKSGRLSLSSAVNPNQFAISMAQLTLVPFIGLLKAKGIGKRLIYGLILIVAAFILLSTGSRSSMFGLILGIVFILMLTKTRGPGFQGLKKIVFFTILFGGLYFVWIILGKLNQAVAGRYTIEAILQKGGTGRFIIWNNLFRYVIPKSMWFGVGLGGENVVVSLANVGGLYMKPAHNIIIDLITQLGIVGLLVYGVFFVITYHYAIKAVYKYPLTFLFAATFIVCLGIGIGETMFYNKLFWFCIAICWKYGKCYNKET